jgi:hypothetical protein
MQVCIEQLQLSFQNKPEVTLYTTRANRVKISWLIKWLYKNDNNYEVGAGIAQFV